MSNQPSSNDEHRTYVKPVMTAVELVFEDDILGSDLLPGGGDALDLFGDF